VRLTPYDLRKSVYFLASSRSFYYLVISYSLSCANNKSASTLLLAIYKLLNSLVCTYGKRSRTLKNTSEDSAATSNFLIKDLIVFSAITESEPDFSTPYLAFIT